VFDYETDDEKVEAIKKWWKENGVAVIAGAAIGLGGIFAWRAWVGYRSSVEQQASAVFEQLLVSTDEGDTDSALAQANLLSEEYASTSYAALAALAQARVELQAGRADGARAALEQVIADSPDPGITRIAALRLARLMIAEGDLAAATALIAKYDDDNSFSGAFAAVRGDIAQAQGRIADARAAYEEAIAAGAPSSELLRLKLDNLPPSG
jgi:predicted negative regulator of RcsB-dependent stress response